MATYTITTTPEQEALLEWITSVHNKEHDTRLTTVDYVTLRLPELLQPYAKRYHDWLLEQVQVKFDAAPSEVKAAVMATLGGFTL